MNIPVGSQNYVVSNALSPSIVPVFVDRDPTIYDLNGIVGPFKLQQLWVNKTTQSRWILQSFSSANGTVTANWIQTSAGGNPIETITGDSGGAVGPSSGNINLVGASGQVTVTGSPGTNTLTISLTGGGTAIDSLIPDSGTSPVVPDASGQITMSGSGSITTVGGTNTLTTQLTGLTNHNVLVGAGTTTIAKVSPSATSGIPLVSNGASADPSFTTAVVAGGGTGSTSFTAYAVICGGTTSTSSLQPIASVGTSGQVLMSNGPGALPSFQSAGNIGSVNVQVFTSNGTYTPTSGMEYCIIEVVGGGGGGGGTVSTSGTAASGGGGGGGGYARKKFTAAQIGASQAITIGAAGTAGTDVANGGTGGTTSVGALISATGGAGGASCTTAAIAVTFSGGAGGAGASGDFQTNGMPGLPGTGVNIGGTGFAASGAGGSSFFGGGAVGISLSASNQTVGTTALSYGGGGSGGVSLLGGTAINGGAGFAGIVVVTEFI
jgi:hypothetical protein